MKLQRKTIIFISIICIFLIAALLIYMKLADSNSQLLTTCADGSIVTKIPSNCGSLNCSDWEKSDIEPSEMTKFIFLKDLTIEQDEYCDGDFPDSKRVTKFKKGFIISGKYSFSDCKGENCFPEKVIEIIVNGQNWPVDISILQPVQKNNSNGTALSGCANLGESFSSVYSQYPKNCCKGLKEWQRGMDTRISISDKCYETMNESGSPVGICLNCGNGICEKNENVCNCAEDCSAKNSEYETINDFCSSSLYKQLKQNCEQMPSEKLPICGIC